jgi:type IV pilus assembly protein PilM
MAKKAWGIDVSKSSIKAVLLEQKGSHIELSQIDVIEAPPLPEEGGPTADELIQNGLRTFRMRNKSEGCAVVCSLPSHATFNRFVKVPPVEEKRVAELVRYEAQQNIPFPLEEVIWDYQRVDKEYEPGEEIEVVLFAIKKDIVTQFLGNVQGAQLEIEGLQFAPVALYNFVTYDQQVGKTSLLLDMGADNADLIVIDQEKFWIRNLPIAGDDITKVLQKKFQIPFAEAEQLKISAAQSPQAAKIFSVIQPVLRDLVTEVHRSIGYYKSLSKTAKLEKMMLFGNATRTLNFQKFVSQNLQLESGRMSKLNKIAISSQVGDDMLDKYFPSLGVAIGLALQGLDVTVNRVNLLPPDLIKKKEVAKKKPLAVVAVALLGILAFLMYVGVSKDFTALASARDAGTVTKDRADKLDRQYKDYTQFIEVASGQKAIDTTWDDTTKDRLNILRQLNVLNGIAPERDSHITVLNAVFSLPHVALDLPNFVIDETLEGTISEAKDKEFAWAKNRMTKDDFKGLMDKLGSGTAVRIGRPISQDQYDELEKEKIWVLAVKQSVREERAEKGGEGLDAAGYTTDEIAKLRRILKVEWVLKVELTIAVLGRKTDAGQFENSKSLAFVKEKLGVPLKAKLGLSDDVEIKIAPDPASGEPVAVLAIDEMERKIPEMYKKVIQKVSTGMKTAKYHRFKVTWTMKQRGAGAPVAAVPVPVDPGKTPEQPK